jgi:hypothetical protein
MLGVETVAEITGSTMIGRSTKSSIVRGECTANFVKNGVSTPAGVRLGTSIRHMYVSVPTAVPLQVRYTNMT